MKGEQIFDSPYVAFDNSPHSLILLDIIDAMKPLLPKLTILHVHNPKKIYLSEAAKGPGIHKYLKERYPEDTNSGVYIDLKDCSEKNTNLIIL